MQKIRDNTEIIIIITYNTKAMNAMVTNVFGLVFFFHSIVCQVEALQYISYANKHVYLFSLLLEPSDDNFFSRIHGIFISIYLHEAFFSYFMI